MDRNQGDKIKLHYDYGLPFAEIELFNGDKSIKLSRVLIDTGSATTIISTETAIGWGLGPHQRMWSTVSKEINSNIFIKNATATNS